MWSSLFGYLGFVSNTHLPQSATKPRCYGYGVLHKKSAQAKRFEKWKAASNDPVDECTMISDYSANGAG